MWIFYFLFWTVVRASEEPLYRKIGDQVVLTPDSVENPITSIRWIHGNNIAMEWYGDEILSYRQFKDRGSLNISTGVMTITGLTPDLSGIYTAEINGKITSKTQLQVISSVPKPTITVLCDPEKTYCVFICSGNITDAEPVTYWWTAGEKRWHSTKEHKITKEEEEQWFICTLENPISSNISEKVSNPFMKSEAQSHNDQTRISIVIAGVTSVLVVFILIITIYLRRKNRKTADLQSFKPQWQYKGERSGDWCDFIETSECAATSDDIEEQYQKNPNGKMLLDGKYELDFKEMTKTNLRTKAKRKIRCVLLPAASPPAEEETSSQNTTSAPETSNETEMALMLPAVPEPTSGVTHSNSYTAVISRAVRFTSNQNQTSVTSTTHSNSNTADFKPQWQFKRRNGGKWHDFRNKRGPLNECSVTNDDIQKHYQDTPHVKMPLTVNGENCELDFKKMILINLEDKTESNIRFVLVIPPSFLKAVSAAFPLKARFARDTVDGTEQEMLPVVQESSNQDSTSVVTYSNSNRAAISTVPEVHETSAQDLEAAEALNPSNDTENPVSPPAVKKTSSQNTTSAAETRNEAE